MPQQGARAQLLEENGLESPDLQQQAGRGCMFVGGAEGTQLGIS